MPAQNLSVHDPFTAESLSSGFLWIIPPAHITHFTTTATSHRALLSNLSGFKWKQFLKEINFQNLLWGDSGDELAR